MPNDDLTFPVNIQKTIGMSPLNLVLLVGVTGFTTLLPTVLGRQTLSAVLYSASLYIFLGVSIVMIAVFFIVRIPIYLKIDQTGVDLTIRKRRYFVVWSDIAHVTPINSTVRIELKGRPDDEAVTIPDGLGLKADKLTALLRDGVARWSASPRASGAGTVTPPGAGKAEARAGLLRAMVLMGGIFGALLLGFFVWQVADYAKDIQLRTHGVRTQGAVVRIYTADCGKRSCSENVEYVYQLPGGKSFHGFGYLTGSDNLDNPNFQYAKSHTTVPIVVDSLKPEISDLNFDDRIYRRDPLKWRLELAGFVIPVILVIPGIFIFVLYLSYRKTAKSGE